MRVMEHALVHNSGHALGRCRMCVHRSAHKSGQLGTRMGQEWHGCAQLCTHECTLVHKNVACGALLCTDVHTFLQRCAQVATSTYAHVEGEIVLDQIGSTSISFEFKAISHT